MINIVRNKIDKSPIYLKGWNTSKINKPPFDLKEMGHWLVKHLDIQWSVSFKPKMICLFLKCSSFSNIVVIL